MGENGSEKSSTALHVKSVSIVKKKNIICFINAFHLTFFIYFCSCSTLLGNMKHGDCECCWNYKNDRFSFILHNKKFHIHNKHELPTEWYKWRMKLKLNVPLDTLSNKLHFKFQFKIIIETSLLKCFATKCMTILLNQVKWVNRMFLVKNSIKSCFGVV